MLKALDLFCGAGGATKGLQRAGFHVTGVDIKPQPRYCGDEFHQSDALTFTLEGFDFIWASPVCKKFSRMSIVRPGLQEKHPNQIPEIRERLQRSGLPYTIENVYGAPLLPGSNFLCGQMFGLGVIRHRWFESSFTWLRPGHDRHKPGHLCIVGHGGPANQRRWKIADAREAMAIDWMSRDEIVEAIPPAYSEFIARQLLQQIAAT
jgi:DNA (cytosine-5)-methyltransferase 1